jgi:hypothetical protein
MGISIYVSLGFICTVLLGLMVITLMSSSVVCLVFCRFSTDDIGRALRLIKALVFVNYIDIVWDAFNGTIVLLAVGVAISRFCDLRPFARSHFSTWDSLWGCVIGR